MTQDHTPLLKTTAAALAGVAPWLRASLRTERSRMLLLVKGVEGAASQCFSPCLFPFALFSLKHNFKKVI